LNGLGNGYKKRGLFRVFLSRGFHKLTGEKIQLMIHGIQIEDRVFLSLFES
jgi:hypothetical protein